MSDSSYIHAMLVHFPIALIVVGFFTDFFVFFFKREVCTSKLGLSLMIIGTVGAIASVLSGQVSSKALDQEGLYYQKLHIVFAAISMVIMVIGSILRLYQFLKKKENSILGWTIFVLYGLGAVAVSIAGFFGSALVYKFIDEI